MGPIGPIPWNEHSACDARDLYVMMRPDPDWDL